MSLYELPEKLATLPAMETLVDGLGSGRVLIEGLWGSASALAALEFSNRTGRSLLILVPDPEMADEVEDDLTTWNVKEILHYPAWDVLPSESEHVELETLRERIHVLRSLAAANKKGTPAIAVAPVTALMQPTIAPEDLRRGELTLSPGDEMAPEALCGRLIDAGLERVAMVDAPGQFARRGGIVDAFPIFSEIPFRLDFFGDQIDSIQKFDVVTQRSEETVEQCVLVDLSTHTVKQAYADRDKAATMAEHLPADVAVFVFDPERCAELARLYEEGYNIEHSALLSYQDACARLLGYSLAISVAMKEEDWPKDWGTPSTFNRITFEISSLTRLEGSTVHAIEEIEKLVGDGNRVAIFCHNEAARSRCREVLLETGGNLAGQVELAIGRISCGFHWPALNWAAIGDQEIFHRYHQRRRMRKRVAPGSPIRNLTQLHSGDYVVHAMHGVAKYTGMTRLEHKGQENDYLTLLFAEDKRLYVPLSHIDLVQKYLGGMDSRPTLARLGGKSWKSKKAQAEKAVREVAADLLRIQAMRQHSPGITYSPDNEWVSKFEDEFIYEETEDQLAAIASIKQDMEKPVPMDRLLCGDVGFGKTEVAIRAAFKAVIDGKQVAVLVPTTILAEQHFRTFSERTADYPVRVDVLSRFRTPSQQRKIVEDAREGRVDILIGTHRIISKDIGFKDLGLVVIDEEQRFGVEHKERLKELRASVDILTMTATPIPRTLHMGLLGMRDISALATPPQDRQAIRTQVVRYNEQLLRRAVLRELARGGQIYFVHNRVQSIEETATKLAELVPEARIGIGHGQMNEHQLAEVMLRFIEHKIDILVATTIIESGLDIPNVNTIFINDADRFGLSELHQLRGRVGRYRNRAYAYFLIPKKRPLSPVGRKRLKAIEEFTNLGAGFDLAMRDLEIRGAGNILGLEQSGHIHQIGYDLYCRLLERVVHEFNGEPLEELEPVELALGGDAFLPEEYINLEEERVRLYRDLAACATPEDLILLGQSVRDRYGKMPLQVEQLFADERLRQRARAVGIVFLGRWDRAISIGFSEKHQQEASAKLLTYAKQGRKCTPLEEGRIRLGLGKYDKEWDGCYRQLAEEAICFLSGEEIPASFAVENNKHN